MIYYIYNCSSDDEIDVLLNGQVMTSSKRCREPSRSKGSDSEDDFEKEMKAELTATMNSLEACHGMAKISPS